MNRLDRIISDNIKKVVNEGRNRINENANGENMIEKWVDFAFNFPDLDDWMMCFEGASPEFFKELFISKECDLNRFYKCLDERNRENLVNLVMNQF